MYDGNPGEIDVGSSEREVRVSEGSSYRESTVVHWPQQHGDDVTSGHNHQKIICRGAHFWYFMHNSYDRKISNQSNDKKRDPRVKRDVFGLVHTSGPKLVNTTQFKVVER